MKLLIIGLLVFCVYGVRAQSKWNTNTLDTVVVVFQKVTKQLKLPDNPTGERKGQSDKMERELRYIDSSLKRIRL
jgi:hypothetical protein